MMVETAQLRKASLLAIRSARLAPSHASRVVAMYTWLPPPASMRELEKILITPVSGIGDWSFGRKGTPGAPHATSEEEKP